MTAVITRTKQQTVVTTNYRVTGVAVEQLQYGTKFFRPAVLVVTETDGTVSGVHYAGPSVKKDGSDGAGWHTCRLYGRSSWPEWVRRFIEGMGR